MEQTSALARLDIETQAPVEDIVASLANRYTILLQGIILFGSVARGDERPLTDAAPSDVDMLAVFMTDRVHELPLMRHVIQLIGATNRRHTRAPREINVVFAGPTLSGWDCAFIEQIARDGIVLYGQASLPLQLSPNAGLQHSA